MFEVCCVGHLCADVLAKTVDILPKKGQLGILDDLKLRSGGCAMNAAIVLGKLGNLTTMVGKVGDDGFGRYLIDVLDANGVNADGLLKDPLSSTSASFVSISSDGERTILHYLGSNKTICFEDVKLSFALNAKILFVGGTFLLPSFDGADCEKLLRFAKDNGQITALDTAWDVTGRWMAVIKDCIKHLDYFMPSYDEAVKLSGETECERIADVFLKLGANSVVIKLGNKGCYVKESGGKRFYSQPFIVEAVDTSGAGDAFCAGFLTGLVKNMDIEDCAIFANAVGALCVTAVGTTDGIKNFKQVQDFIAAQKNSPMVLSII